MARYRFLTVDVFTDRVFGGNPLAVLPDARGLDGETMQRVANEFHLSETVFVLPPEASANTRRVRIFTPSVELPFAGHPTVGTAFVLAISGEVQLAGGGGELVLEEGVGPVSVTVEARDGQPIGATLRTAKLPERGPATPPREALAAALSLAPEDLLEGARSAEGWSCGVPFLLIPVRDRLVLARAAPDRGEWRRRVGSWWTANLFVFCHDPERPGSDVRARMFAPEVGVEEDPATGSAAAALAGYLASRNPISAGELRWVIEQGFEMGRPSILELSVIKLAGEIAEVRVGGRCVPVSEGWMEVPGA